MLLDLDHFKAVNDRYGHDLGDEVLQGISGVLRKTLRETDLVARYGGEEFGVILPRTPVTEAYTVAECLRQTVAQARWSIECEALRVTTSAGLAEARPDDDESSLLRRADESLYAAKRTGRNRCCWNDGAFPRMRVRYPRACTRTALLTRRWTFLASDDSAGRKLRILPRREIESRGGLTLVASFFGRCQQCGCSSTRTGRPSFRSWKRSVTGPNSVGIRSNSLGRSSVIQAIGTGRRRWRQSGLS